jgi:hypothetical protein
MLRRREFLLGLGASASTIAILPGCKTLATVSTKTVVDQPIEDWIRAAVDDLALHVSVAWGDVVTSLHRDVTVDVIGESQHSELQSLIQLGIVRKDGSSENRTILAGDRGLFESTVAAMKKTAQWSIPSAQKVKSSTVSIPRQSSSLAAWRPHLQKLLKELVAVLHSRVIYHAVALRLDEQQRWTYRRVAGDLNGQDAVEYSTKQLWHVVTASREGSRVDFEVDTFGTAKATPDVVEAIQALPDLLKRVLRRATPNQRPQGTLKLVIAPRFAAQVLARIGLRGFAHPRLRLSPRQDEVYGGALLRFDGSPTIEQPFDTNSIEGESRSVHFVLLPSVEVIQPPATDLQYFLEDGAVSVARSGELVLWPRWTLELRNQVTTGRAFRDLVFRTNVETLLAARDVAPPATVVIAHPSEIEAKQTWWSATVPSLQFAAEIVP